MRTIILSDCHIGNKACNVAKINRFLLNLECSRLILAGDFWDLAAKNADDIRRDHKGTIELLQRLLYRGIKIEYILGICDKDYLSDPVIPLYEIPIFKNWKETLPDGRKVCIIHGHEFDPAYEKSWLNWISFGLLGNKLKPCSELRGKPYIDSINAINNSARKHYSGKCDVLIMGHTHAPLSAKSKTGLVEYFNSGDWEYHNSYIVIDGPTIALRYVADPQLPADRWFRINEL
jgi:UDP-2,3-diacylglucosamine pyrophosphatase LpxH